MQQIGRRFVLGAAVAGVGAVSTSISNKGSRTQAATTTSTLRAVIMLNGVKYDFHQEDGQSLGNFTSSIGGFTQSCIRTRVTGCPITVFFRPDVNSTRAEVVFECGQIFNASPVNLGTYSVIVYRGTAAIASITAPKHYWFSRWRWQSAPRPVVADVDNLIAQNLLPPYDREVVSGTPSTTTKAAGTYVTGSISKSTSTTTEDPYTTFVPYAIMGLAGVTPYMPQTGERDDIGLVTECQGAYICTSDQTALDQLRAQGEAAGTVPWHMRDENTGAPVNFETYPKAAWFTGQPGVGTPYVKTLTTPITVDDAHQPALSYVPYLLTGDPYYLEELQFQATWNYGSMSVGYRPTLSQPRQFAWSMRTLSQCAKVTPATVPSWLLKQAYWASLLTAHRTFFETNYVYNSTPSRSLFRASDNIDAQRADVAPAGTWCDPWQHEFLACVFGWLVKMGFSDWLTSFKWQIGSTIARTGTSSGWIRAQATPYEMVLRATAASPYATSWQSAWNLAQSISKLSYANPNTWVSADMTYLTYSRGALVYAKELGCVLQDNLSWATGQLNSKNWPTAYKWRLGTGLT